MQTTTLKSLLTSATCALAVAVCAVMPLANAGTVNHGMFMGPTVAYHDVTETSTSNPPPNDVPLYGAPITIGDTLAFFEPTSSNPSVGFNAQSTGGVGDLTDGFLNLVIMAKPGNGISSLTFSEGGDYTMSGLGAALAQVSASLNVFELSIIGADGAPIAPVVLSDTQSVTLNLPGDPASGQWNLSSTFNLDAALAGAGHSPVLGATKVIAKINNTLTALSQPGSVAGIFKKDFDITPETNDIPEPTTLVLAAFGVIGILAKRRAS